MRIVDGGAADIPRLEPLWLAMVAHPESANPAAAEAVPFRDPPEAWRRRRARYEQWIHEPGARLLLAEAAGGVRSATRSCASSTASDDGDRRPAHMESLAVLPETRGNGVGSALIDASFAYLRGLGLTEITSR